jgi:hypothetical protein
MYEIYFLSRQCNYNIEFIFCEEVVGMFGNKDTSKFRFPIMLALLCVVVLSGGIYIGMWTKANQQGTETTNVEETGLIQAGTSVIVVPESGAPFKIGEVDKQVLMNGANEQAAIDFYGQDNNTVKFENGEIRIYTTTVTRDPNTNTNNDTDTDDTNDTEAASEKKQFFLKLDETGRYIVIYEVRANGEKVEVKDGKIEVPELPQYDITPFKEGKVFENYDPNSQDDVITQVEQRYGAS